VGYNKEGRDKNGHTEGWYRFKSGFEGGFEEWSPVSSYGEALYTFRPGDNGVAHGFTVGVFGAYGSFSFNDSLDEFVVGYTLNLLSARHWGLGLPLGIGRNNLEKQLVMEAGLQFRFAFIELRGTYRLIGFREHSLTISGGYCLWERPGLTF
jgi:hypothetical protein